MMIIHEMGHASIAVATGGTIDRISIPLFGFSETQFSTNPRPVLVAWGGFVLGILVPVAAWAAAAVSRLSVEPGIRWFAAVCLLANGAYMSSALGYPIGDVDDILRHGGSALPLQLLGPAVLAGGLLVIFRRGVMDLFRAASGARMRGVALASLSLALTLGLALLVSRY